MDNDQITALAREYAEECIEPQGFSKSTYEELVEEKAENVAYILRWLSARFCLVEKSVIKKTWSEITNVYLAHRHITYDGARYLFDEVLFPDLGKEVEG